MRRLHVLYAGPVLAGRSTSLASLSEALWHDNSRPKPTHRLEGKEVHLSSGETVLLNAMVPHTGNLHFESIKAATRTDVDWIRELALAVIEFLPKINGVVFVADSWPHQQYYNLESLRVTLRELNDAGLDADRLPFVFQCNKRDDTSVLPFAQMAASLSTARCAHVESVATVGYGVTRALESLVALIDRGASGAGTSLPELGNERAKSAPISPHRLFEEATMDLTCDGQVRAALRTSTRTPELALTHGAIAPLGSMAPTEVPGFAPGRYAVDVVERLVSHLKPVGWRVIDSRFIAIRIRLRDATVVSHERLAPAGLSGLTSVIGSPPAVRAATHYNLAAEASAQTRAEGVSVVAWRGSRLEPASRGEMAVFALYAKYVWLGRDEAGRVVEVSCYGGDGAAVLEQMA
jgi:hypothetical protein